MKANQREYVEGVAKDLGFQDYSSWYNITQDQIKKYNMEELLAQYGGSIGKLLITIYEEYP